MKTGPAQAGPSVLIVTPYPLVPVTSGGKARVWQFAHHLSRLGFRVTALVPYRPGQSEQFDPDCGFELRQVFYPFLLPLLVTDRPFPYGHLVSIHPGLPTLLRRLFAQYDIIQFEQAFWGGLVDVVSPDQIVIYNSHNVERDYLVSECPEGRIRDITDVRARRLEGRLWRRADLSLCCTQADAERLEEIYGAPPSEPFIAPNGIRDIPSTPEPAVTRALIAGIPGLDKFPRRAVYSGSNVEHNRVAVRWILNDLAPRAGKDWAFIIHGGAGEQFRDQPAPDNVFFDADWRGFDRYTGSGIVGLNPVTQGSGMNLKLLNYLAHRLPTVTTEFGLRGCEDLASLAYVSPLEKFAESLDFVQPPDDSLERRLKPYLWSAIVEGSAHRFQRLVKQNQSNLEPQATL